MRRNSPEARESGFSMIEALAGLTITATIVASLAAMAGQWLPNWSRGFAGLQQADLLTVGVERIVGDIAAAEYITPYGGAAGPVFDGRESSLTFVRSAIGPDAYPHLELVRFAEARDDRGLALARARCAFAPVRKDDAKRCLFRDPVSLIRAPYRVTFAYAGADRVWRDKWIGQDSLPEAVRITIGKGAAGTPAVASTTVRIRVIASGALKDEEEQRAEDGTLPAAPSTSPAAARRREVRRTRQVVCKSGNPSCNFSSVNAQSWQRAVAYTIRIPSDGTRRHRAFSSAHPAATVPTEVLYAYARRSANIERMIWRALPGPPVPTAASLRLRARLAGPVAKANSTLLSSQVQLDGRGPRDGFVALIASLQIGQPDLQVFPV